MSEYFRKPIVKTLMLKGEKGETGDSDYKPAVDALGKRIDNLILSSGTESSAEVVDARTGYDGTAHDTLGTAIRKQVSELKGDLNSQMEANFYEKEIEAIYDWYIDADGVTIKPTTDWQSSELLPINGYTHVRYNLTTHSAVSSLCFYDESKNVLQMAVIGETTTETKKQGYVSVPKGAYYVRCSFRSGNNDYAYLYYTEKEHSNWLFGRINFTDNAKANELIKEFYLGNEIAYTEVTKILFLKSAISGGRYKNGFRIYTGDSYTEKARVFGTQEEAEADLLAVTTSYNGIYAVVDWERMQTGTTVLIELSLNNKVENLLFSPTIKHEVENANKYVTDYRISNVIKELYIPNKSKPKYDVNKIYINKAFKDGDYYHTGIIIGTTNSTDKFQLQSPTYEGALEFCKKEVFDVNGIQYIIEWDKIKDGTRLVSNDGVSLMNDAFSLCYNPSIKAYLDRTKPNNMANPLLETMTTWNATHDISKVTKSTPFNSTNKKGLQWRNPVCIVANNGNVLVSASERIGNISDEAEMTISICTNPMAESPTITELFEESGYTFSNPSFVVDRTGVHGVVGRIYLFAYKCVVGISPQNTSADNVDCVYRYSDNDGESWSDIISLKALWDSSRYVCGIPAPANGIQTSDGTLIVPCMFGGLNSQWLSGVLYKKQNEDWVFSNVTPYIGDNECTVYEDYSGNIILNCRTYDYHLRNIYKYDITTDTFEQINHNFDAMVTCQMQIIKGTADTLDVYLMSYCDVSNANSGWERNRNHPTIWVSDDGLRWIRAYRADEGNEAGYTCVNEYNGKRVMVYEDLSDYSVSVQDISAIDGLLYNTMRTQYNREIEYRLQEVIDKLLLT